MRHQREHPVSVFESTLPNASLKLSVMLVLLLGVVMTLDLPMLTVDLPMLNFDLPHALLWRNKRI